MAEVPSSTKTLTFLADDDPQILAIHKEESVLELALKHGVPLDHSCGGMGCCTTCRIIVVSDVETLPERNEFEQERADERDFAPFERLACQLEPQAGMIFKIPR